MIAWLYLTGLARADYDTRLAKITVYASWAAFEDPDALQAWSCEPCKHLAMSDVKVLVEPTYEFQLFVGYNHNTSAVVVSYRGSSNIDNWIEDFKIELVPYEACNCRVHLGFMQVQEKIRKWVLTEVMSLRARRNAKGVLVTGHSLGAAVATLGALDLQKNGVKLVYPVYTFGEPHVGDKAFADYTQATIQKYRVVHNHDIVPHIPPYPIYYHPPTEIWYDNGMQSFRECSKTNGEDMTCSEGTYKLSAEDHHIERYADLRVTNG